MGLETKAIGKIFGLLGVAVVLSGCPPKQTAVTPEEMEAPAETEAPAEDAGSAEAGAPAMEIGTDWTEVPGLGRVQFDYMSSDLTADSRAALKKNTAVIKAVLKRFSGVKVRLEGHCDDRGTLEYNLALGQRRANALRDYYASLGLPKSALTTVSYGEERPLCSDAAEPCWTQNRRGETTLKSAQPVRIPLSELPQ